MQGFGMYAVISLDGRQNIFNQLLSELKFALKDLTTQELCDILLKASGQSLKATYDSKKQSLKNIASLSQKAFSYAKQNAARYKTDGFRESAINDIKRAGAYASSIPSRLRGFYDNFLSLPREKQIETVAMAVLMTAIYLTCCGGLDAEGGLPDMDITLAGIGHHRSLFSHSIILGLGVEFSGRLMILVLGKIRDRLPENHHPGWDKTYEFIDRNKGKAIAAMWLGIGTHLIKDSGLFAGGLKPYSDLPLHMSKGAHQATFAMNGIASGAFAQFGKTLQTL